MDHEFQASLTDSKACIRCKRGYRDHSKIAQCEACPNVGPCELFADMLLCAKCYAAELKAVHDYQAPELQEARLQEYHKQVRLNELLADAAKQDQTVTLVSDLFNAETKSLIELLTAIDSSDIENKPYARAEFTVNRIKTFQQALFEAKNKVVELENAIRADQVYLNQEANKLRDEERTKLKIADITYQPATPKTPKPKSDKGTKAAKKSSKVDMAEVQKWAGKIGMPVQLVHMRMLSKNMSAEQAARTFAAESGLTVKE